MGNAEDFTKQFMGDMFGSGGKGQQPMPQPPPMQQQQYQSGGGHLLVNQSENIDTSSNKPKKGCFPEKELHRHNLNLKLNYYVFFSWRQFPVAPSQRGRRPGRNCDPTLHGPQGREPPASTSGTTAAAAAAATDADDAATAEAAAATTAEIRLGRHAQREQGKEWDDCNL